MKCNNFQNYSENKWPKILLGVIGLVAVVSCVVAVILERWDMVIILCCILMGLVVGFVPGLVREHYNPLVERKKQHFQQHPEDIPLNPWDNLTGDEEK